MGVAEIVAFFRALPELVKVLGEVVSTLQQLRQDSIDKELASIKQDVDTNIQILTQAHTDDERKKALLALSVAIHR